MVVNVNIGVHKTQYTCGSMVELTCNGESSRLLIVVEV